MPIALLDDTPAFPHPSDAEPEGVLAIGGDLSPERLVLAYREGIFPWYSAGDPLLWWSPDPRMVLFPPEFHTSRRFRRVLKNPPFTVTCDTAFSQVIRACARQRTPGREETWITPEMEEAYIQLHRQGHAHSIECWQNGELAGGLYGVAMGACFSGESMFTRAPNASKVALAKLAEFVGRWDGGLIDCQMYTPHLERHGAREVPRRDFLALLAAARAKGASAGSWTEAFAGAAGSV
ncbi:MAG: leucyl/phenylalanyl-tRNA--protein transferase [Candidatus Hydrogenedentota bacterium]